MVTSNKILTVTYGTFSCRLEGFDDPFTTLQKVAEYFRKLAAQDRHFGGVQQMPDTDVLMQIANQENPSGVDAEVDSSGIVLRQKPATDATPARKTETESEAVPTPEAAPDEPEAAPADQEDDARTSGAIERLSTLFRSRRHTTEASEDESPAKAAAEPVAEDAGTAADHEVESRPRPPLKQSVADTLAAIRRNVEQAGTGMTISEALESDDKYEEDEDEHAEQADAQSMPDVAETAGEADDDDTPQDAEIAAEIATALSEAASDDDAEPATAEDDQSAIADDLEGDEDAAIEDTVEAIDEDTHEAVAEDDETVAETEAPTETEDDIDAVAEAAAAVAETGENTNDADEPFAASADKQAEEVSFDTGVAVSEDQTAIADTDDADSDLAFDDLAEDDSATTGVAPDGVDDDAAFDDDFFRAGKTDPTQKSSLSDAEEEELARDLEAAMEAGNEAEPVDSAADTRRRERRARAEALRGIDPLDQEDKALDRLLEAAQHKMDRPEQRRRLDALDQLKAAVAATEAEAQMSDGKPDEDEVEAAADLAAYRDDLRRAQERARNVERPGGAARRSEPPARPAQAPLILVSEQRIDDQPDNIFAPDAPDHRREVAESDGNLALKRRIEVSHDHDDSSSGDIQGIPADAFTEATTFADFADRIGVSDMQDMLEAAAAFTSIVEGKPRFSRAQVMSKIARIETGDGFSKEAGLRAFGKLLREGKILRVQDGQFAISKSSRFSIAQRQD